MITLLDYSSVSCIAKMERDLFEHFWNEQQIREHLTSGNLIWGYIDDHGDLRGFLIVSEISGEWEIYRIATDSQVRRKGVATQLLDALSNRCSDGDQIFLEVRADNRSAYELYLSNGFTESGRRKKYYSDAEDAVLMMKSIKTSGILTQ